MVNAPIKIFKKKDALDIGNLLTLPVDLKKLRDAVDNEVVKKHTFDTLKRKENNLNMKTTDGTNLIHINQ